MSWGKLDDGWYDNPKLKDAGPEAKALHATAISYCSKHLTDGVLSEKGAVDLAGGCVVGKTTARDLVDRMVYHRLFDEEIDGDAVTYRVHDYLVYNFTRAKVVAKRQAESEGGKHGNEVRWHGLRDGVPDGVPDRGPDDIPHPPVPYPARPQPKPLVRGTANQGTEITGELLERGRET